MNMATTHRLTWRGWIPVFVSANTREEAIAKALAEKPHFIPQGTELHYGMVGGPASVVGFA
jgi:hypothetical protein